MYEASERIYNFVIRISNYFVIKKDDFHFPTLFLTGVVIQFKANW
jgi:hypothetical protein